MPCIELVKITMVKVRMSERNNHGPMVILVGHPNFNHGPMVKVRMSDQGTIGMLAGVAVIVVVVVSSSLLSSSSIARSPSQLPLAHGRASDHDDDDDDDDDDDNNNYHKMTTTTTTRQRRRRRQRQRWR